MSSTGYKALMLDVDGTLARADLYVSPQVAKAVGRASARMAVARVSSRDHIVVGELASGLGLKGLQVRRAVLASSTWRVMRRPGFAASPRTASAAVPTPFC